MVKLAVRKGVTSGFGLMQGLVPPVLSFPLIERKTLILLVAEDCCEAELTTT